MEWAPLAGASDRLGSWLTLTSLGVDAAAAEPPAGAVEPELAGAVPSYSMIANWRCLLLILAQSADATVGGLGLDLGSPPSSARADDGSSGGAGSGSGREANMP